MQTPTTSPTPSRSKQAKSEHLKNDSLDSVKRQPSDVTRVGEGLPIHCLTDEEREAAIKRAGQAMEAAYAKYTKSGCFSDHGHATHLLNLMGKLIEGRSPEFVAKLEKDRGLA